MRPAEVRVVLVRPETPANVGAVARVIHNTGLDGLDLVEPCDWRSDEARRLAWRSQHLLDRARTASTVGEAVAGAHYVAGLSGRAGTRVESITARQMAHEVAGLGTRARVALVFGPESRGLSEEELLCCQRRVRIPSSRDMPSLNLAQAVMVTAYEVGLAIADPRLERPVASVERAGAADVERAYAALMSAMLAIDFLPVENPEARFVEWRELFGRAGLTAREVKLVMALARRMRGAGRAARRAKEGRRTGA